MWASAALVFMTLFVFVSCAWTLRRLEDAIARYGEQYSLQGSPSFRETFLLLTPGPRRVLCACSLALWGALGGWLGGPLVAVIAAVLGGISPEVLHRHLGERRWRLFHEQLANALQALASALCAGLSLQQALEHVARDAPEPFRPELGLVVKELKLGVGMDRALQHWLQRIPSDDLSLVVQATLVARQMGGNLAETYESLAANLRERFRMEGRVAALTAQGRMQGWIVAMMPAALGVAFHALRPDLMRPMFRHPFGWTLLGLIVVMEAVGVLLIRRIVRIDLA